MKSILGIGNALTDILAVLPDDSLLRQFHLPVGSMQHVDKETGNKIWQVLKKMGAQYVAGGAAGNTITGTAVFGMPSGFIGKVLELCPEDLKPEYFTGYDYFFIEGYLVQNQQLLRQAVRLAREAGCYIAIDMASYNVVESNDTFLHDIVEQYVDIVFANETEAGSFTRHEPREAVDIISDMCDIAVVKIGAKGSYIRSGDEFHHIEACPADVKDATGAGDLYAAGFLYAHALGMPLDICGRVGSITASKVVEVVGPKIDIPRWKAAKREIRALIAENL